MPSLTSTSAAASVELTSPGTNARSGGSAATTRSSRFIARAGCSACEAGRAGCHDPLESLHRASRRLGMRAGSDVEPMCWARKVELIDEELRELRVVVLTCVDDHMLGARKSSRELGDNRRHLDEVRPRAHDVEK